jgi:hypothetical protein
MGKKPTIRIVRNMARSGGTLIGKCVGCMDGVVQLSEVHPGNLQATNPMMQASKWFDLVNKKDISRWKQSKGPTMLQFVSICHMRAEARGEKLVLRDWSHLDYLGAPFVKPGYGFGLAESIEAAFEVLHVSTTRHPIDQYLSMQSFPGMENIVTIEEYLKGCVAFARFAKENGFVRYEDFVADPDRRLAEICGAIDLGFDSSYAGKWSSYTTITGDKKHTGGRATVSDEIKPMARKRVGDGLMDRFRACEEYAEVCGLLGYEE